VKRFAGRRAALRVLSTWLITALAVEGLALIIPGLHVHGFGAALAAAAVIGLINALVWPVLTLLALPIGVITIGLSGLVLNGLVVTASARLLPGFGVDSLWSGIGLAIGLTLINTLVTALLGIDDDDFYYRNVVRLAARRRGAISSEVPGVVFLEIDGLAHEVLVRAMRSGDTPNLARWLRDGSHRLLRWETDWSSQTGACQAGLLHGSNDDMPAFRWWEKERGVAMVTNHPKDAMEIERRHSNGRGLLAFDGASRANILSGDAPHSLLTMSTVRRRDRPGRLGQDYFAYFSNPYSVSRTLILSIAEVTAELWNAAQQRRRDVAPRIERDFTYSLVRAWATVIQRDLQIHSVMADIYAGRPVVYTTFLGYDEVAHHSGIERHDTLEVLRQIDRQFQRVVTAARDAPRPYRFVVLSDHGQSQGATFLQRAGKTLEDVVREASGAVNIETHQQGSEGIAYLSGSLTEAGGGSGAIAGAVRTATRSLTNDGEVRLEDGGRGGRQKGDAAKGNVPELVVMASGSLGLVYFPRHAGRLTLEQIEELYPAMISTLRDHPAVGFLMVRSDSAGVIAIGARGLNYLDQGRVEREDPLGPYGPNAARHLKRTDGFEHVGDIMLNAAYDPESTEIPAFEELVGSHGGMGGSQSFPFVLYPADWQAPTEPIVGAEQMHRHLRHWLAELGHDAYRRP
jgi:uncharacterized membrane protein YvlD (DUF360 family)